MRQIKLILLAALFLPIGLLYAQEPSGRKLQTGAYFNVGSSVLDMGIMNQRANLERFIGSLKQVLADSNYSVKQVEVVGTASPEGSYERNMKLAGERAEALAAYIVQNSGITIDQLKVVNGGENWAGLRTMITESSMPYRSDILRLMDTYASDNAALKRQLRYYASSGPWSYMIRNFFPLLRMGSGSGAGESILVEANWREVSQLVDNSGLSSTDKQRLLSIVQSKGSAALRTQRIKDSFSDSTYAPLRQHLVSGLLNSMSALSRDNWSLLSRLVTQDINSPDRAQVLSIIDNVGSSFDWQKQFRALSGGVSYRYIQDHFFSALLVDSTFVSFERNTDAKVLPAVDSITLSESNWSRLRSMVEQSDMEGKADVLLLIDTVSDPVSRTSQLQKLNGGRSYIYFQEVFIPELLDEVSPAAQENWAQARSLLSSSDLSNKDTLMQVILTTSAGSEREQALRSIDNGASWNIFSETLLPELLGSSDQSSAGSGVRFSYGLSEKAQAREVENRRRIRVLIAKERILAMNPPPVVAPVVCVREESQSEDPVVAAKTLRYKLPAFALKTNLLFDLVTAVNLEVEVPLSNRWSVMASAVFPQWHYNNRHSLILTDISLEGRFWLSKSQSEKWGTDRNSLTGHFIGLYGNWMPNYDFQYGKQGVEGSGFGFGLTYGFVHRLSRSFNMEYSLGVGGVSVQGKQFTVRDDYQYKLLTREYSGFYVLPTRAKVSLVWLIGNKQKK